jgi:hypothetical protein
MAYIPLSRNIYPQYEFAVGIYAASSRTVSGLTFSRSFVYRHPLKPTVHASLGFSGTTRCWIRSPLARRFFRR